MRYAISNYVERNSTHRILTMSLQSLDNRSDVQMARMAHGCVLWRIQRPSHYSQPRYNRLSIPIKFASVDLCEETKENAYQRHAIGTREKNGKLPIEALRLSIAMWLKV